MKKFPDTDGAIRRLTLANDLRQVSLLTGFVDRVREDNGLAPALAARINLALEEAVCNVIMYAYPEGTAGEMDLDAVRDGNQLRFTLIDRGKAFDPTAAPGADLSAPLEDRPIGGLGIHLVRSIMDSIRYERRDGKNVLTMIIHL
ncbi:MAG: ATP-binding protein [Bacteroidales bacterium]|nr:ATP-binding protein [Bacteroidales bacterium]